jgi:hypothetical protein
VNTITGTGGDLIDGKFDLQPFARRPVERHGRSLCSASLQRQSSTLR